VSLCVCLLCHCLYLYVCAPTGNTHSRCGARAVGVLLIGRKMCRGQQAQGAGSNSSQSQKVPYTPRAGEVWAHRASSPNGNKDLSPPVATPWTADPAAWKQSQRSAADLEAMGTPVDGVRKWMMANNEVTRFRQRQGQLRLEYTQRGMLVRAEYTQRGMLVQTRNKPDGSDPFHPARSRNLHANPAGSPRLRHIKPPLAVPLDTPLSRAINAAHCGAAPPAQVGPRAGLTIRHRVRAIRPRKSQAENRCRRRRCASRSPRAARSRRSARWVRRGR
jgi:hypothetical protein